MAEPLTLDWSTAEVGDETLTVSLSAKPNKEWRSEFATTVTLLGSHHREVTLDKDTVTVTGVGAGDEEQVHQLLEGAVLQANTTIADESELFGTATREDDADEDDATEGSEGDAESADETATARFREFAEPADERSDERDDAGS